VAALKSLRDVPTLLDPGSSLLGGAAGSRNGVVDAGGSAGSRGGVGDGVKTPTVAARFWIRKYRGPVRATPPKENSSPW